MKKKTFIITIPMVYTLSVEAENEKEALDIYCKKEINKAIDHICKIYERFSTIKQYGNEGDTDSDGYESAREGLDLLIDEKQKLYEAMCVIVDMADILKDNDLLDE